MSRHSTWHSALRTWRLVLGCVLGLILAGCGSVEQRQPVPEALIDEATPVGYRNVRFWGDFNSPEFIRSLMGDRASQVQLRFSKMSAAGRTPHLRYLAVSGGGQYGAFAAGILKGWTETGTRPQFEGVTGISTGSIIAPFAFLGP